MESHLHMPKSASPFKRKKYIALIADMVGSKKLSPDDRSDSQKRFNRFVADLNNRKRYKAALVSKFVITMGDEFQAVLDDASVIPDLIWDISFAESLPGLRIGFGCGTIDTDMPEYAINLDGPALHEARRAIELSKHTKQMGGVFVGFGTDVDTVANAIAHLMWDQMTRLSPFQRAAITFLQQGCTYSEVAERTARSPQSISGTVHQARWSTLREGRSALGILLASAIE
jgi:SatD family (SatD)